MNPDKTLAKWISFAWEGFGPIEVSKILILTVRDFLSIAGGCPLLVDHPNNAFQNNSLLVVAKMTKKICYRLLEESSAYSYLERSEI